MKKTYTVCQGLRKTVSLLFGGPDLPVTEIDVDAIRKDPGVNNLFPAGFFIHYVGDKNPRRYRWRGGADDPDEKKMVLVSSDMPEDLDPDTAALGAEGLRFNQGGLEVTVSLRKRFNQCLSLFKATGCSTCPERGVPCIGQAMVEQLGQAQVFTHFENNLDEDDLIRRLTENKTVLGGHEFVSPSLTREESFSSVYRPYWEHGFKRVEDNIKEFSTRGTKAAETRKFKREHCSTCIIKPGCSNARWCKGPMPSEYEIIKQATEELDEVIKNSALPEWQIWELIRGMGSEAKYSRWQIYLCGVDLKDGKFVPSMSRRKVSIDDFRHPKLQTYEELADVFGLAKDHTQAKGRVQDHKLRAIFWLAMQKLGYGGYKWGRVSLLAVGCDDSKVTAQWTKPRYLSYDCTLKDLSDVASNLTHGDLPGVERKRVR